MPKWWKRGAGEDGEDREDSGDAQEPTAESAEESEATARIRAMLDPHDYAASAPAGDGALYLAPGQVLDNMRELMERIDQDPQTSWAVEDVVSFDEMHVMVVQLGYGSMLITETAWTARKILAARWPQDMVEGAIADPARLDMFLDTGLPVLSEEHQQIAKAILNRALASPTEVEEHPELADLDDASKIPVWIGLMTWYYVKTATIQQTLDDGSWQSADIPDRVDFAGPTYDPATGRFQFAQTEDGTVDWELHEPGVGVKHGLIVGDSSLGKTNICRLILAEALASERFAVMVADPAGRGKLCDLFARPAERVARTPLETRYLLQAAVKVLQRRASAGGYTDPTADKPGLLIVIDDAHTVLTDPAAADLAAQIVTAGGPVGVGIVIASPSLDPTDYAHNTELMARLSIDNAVMGNPAHHPFLRRLWSEHGLQPES